MKESVTFTIFDEATRRPVSRVTCDEDQIEQHVKEGQRALRGRLDWTTRLTDEGEAVADQQRERLVARERRKQAAQIRIEELERKMLRRVREVLAASDPQLQQIDDEVTALRASLSED